MSDKLEIKVLESAAEKAILEAQLSELCANIPFFSNVCLRTRVFLAALKDAKVVGLVSIVKESHRVPGAFGIELISVHQGHRNQGIAKALVHELFELARKCRKDIANTAYKPDGELWLKPLMTTKAAAYPQVKLYER